MKKSRRHIPLCSIPLLMLCVHFAGICRDAHAQSSTVFLAVEKLGLSTRLVRFDGDQQQEVFGDNSSTFVTATTFNGNLFLGDIGTWQILRVSPAGEFLGVFASPNIPPAFIESDSKGNIYASSFGVDYSGSIRLDPTGVLTQSYSGFDFRGIDGDAAGNVYIANDIGNALLKFDSNGNFLHGTSVAFSPFDIAIDEAGQRLFVSDLFSDGAGIKVFDISGTTPSYLRTLATPPLTRIHGLHFAPESGHVFATDDGGYSRDPRGLEFTADGALLREYRASFPGSLAVDDIVSIVPEPTSCMLAGMLVIVSSVYRFPVRR